MPSRVVRKYRVELAGTWLTMTLPKSAIALHLIRALGAEAKGGRHNHGDPLASTLPSEAFLPSSDHLVLAENKVRFSLVKGFTSCQKSLVSDEDPVSFPGPLQPGTVQRVVRLFLQPLWKAEGRAEPRNEEENLEFHLHVVSCL